MSRAENVGDLITADNKVLSEESESRNNHRYAVVVQDLATQETQKSLIKETKSHLLTIPWNLASLVRKYPGDQKHVGLQKEQCAE